MSQNQRYLDRQEIGRKGRELYKEKITAQVEKAHKGRIVSIDVTTGDYEIGDSILTAAKRLFERNPAAEPWSIRVGGDAIYHLGIRSLKQNR